MLTAVIAITVVYIPQYFHVVRNTVLSVREEPYVEAVAARRKRRTVIRRYVFANVVHSVPVVASSTRRTRSSRWPHCPSSA